MRNRRWSVMQPIPSLGDHTTPIEDVDKFYNFWYNFKSWREFSDDDDYDLEQAESPEHKRWMERQNAKLHEKAKKDIVDGVPLYVSSNCLHVKALKYEPAGHSFHAVAMKLLDLGQHEEEETDDPSVS
uniref:Zuotin-like zuotin homology domain-containing protein n=1 Tax=Zea mays TaxID=4577 RepID=A0A804R686_MAIZE